MQSSAAATPPIASKLTNANPRLSPVTLSLMTRALSCQNASTSLTRMRSRITRPHFSKEPALTGSRLYPRLAKYASSCAPGTPQQSVAGQHAESTGTQRAQMSRCLGRAHIVIRHSRLQAAEHQRVMRLPRPRIPVRFVAPRTTMLSARITSRPKNQKKSVTAE